MSLSLLHSQWQNVNEDETFGNETLPLSQSLDYIFTVVKLQSSSMQSVNREM